MPLVPSLIKMTRSLGISAVHTQFQNTRESWQTTDYMRAALEHLESNAWCNLVEYIFYYYFY